MLPSILSASKERDMSFHRVIISLMAMLSLLFSSPAWADSERISSFVSRIKVQPDAGILVTETIKVNARGQEIKRGIVRDFPTTYTGRFGSTVKVGFEILDVLKNGEPEPYHTEKASNGIKIYIGQSDVFLSPGQYIYTLKYRTDRQIGFFDDYDEIYWNVTGNAWTFVIEHAEAIVELPPGGRVVQDAAYTGPSGAAGKDFRKTVDEAGHIRFTTTRPLNPGEGLTVAVAWPKGLVTEPDAAQKLTYFFQDNAAGIVALIWAVVIFIYYLICWFLVGRDPAKGTIVPLYSPPDNLGPAAMRFIYRMGFDHKAFAAAVVNMAVKGALTIEEEGDGEFVLSKHNGDMTGLTSGERQIASKLFSSRDAITLTNINHRTISNAIKALKKSLKVDYEKINFAKNVKYLVPGIILTVMALASTVFFASEMEMALFSGIWLTGWSVGVFFLVLTAYRSWKGARTKKAVMSALFMTLFALPFVIGELAGIVFFAWSVSIPAATGILLAVFFSVVFYQLLKAPTLQGRRIMDRIEGFKMYLSVAEKERLGIIHPPEKTPALFETYLPYAMALNVEQEWGEQFTDVLAQATAEGHEYSPRWYHGSSFSRFGAAGLAGGLGGAFSGAISSSSTAPGSSSGSSGGGSSGGGGGGGGGSGW
jgi:uncharacterized membrane protein YgcG